MTMADDYKVELPDDLKGLKVDVNHPDFKALQAVAKEEGWSAKSFNRVLELEARRTMAKAPAPAAVAPAPAPAPRVDFDKMSTRQQFAHSLANGPTRQKQG
jgi:hypothetical protein